MSECPCKELGTAHMSLHEAGHDALEHLDKAAHRLLELDMPDQAERVFRLSRSVSNDVNNRLIELVMRAE